MIFKIMYFIKYFKPSFKWRLPYLLAICTIPTITLTHFSCVEYGIKVGVTIGFFGSIPVICYACHKVFMEQWLEEEDD
tara:strand:+ start:1116 stop:1349 length:234 start_codon:yes stop_codon:yes gene_type:complete